MNNRILLLMIASLCVVLVSCQSDVSILDTDASFESSIELTKEELLSISYEGNPELSNMQVTNVLSDFIGSRQASRSLQLSNVDIRFVSKHEVNGGESMMKSVDKVDQKPYVCEMETTLGANKYVALVSADRRFPYVIAYFSKDDKSREDEQNIALVKFSEKFMLHNIAYIQSLRDSLYNTTIKKVTDKLSLNGEKIELGQYANRIKLVDAATRAQIITTEPDNAIAGNGPFIQVSWDQGMPYNRLMDQNCSDNWLWDYRYPISSVVVSTAEILSYFRPSMTVGNMVVDWDYLCKNEEIFEDDDYFGSHVQDPIKKRNMVATLMKYIGEQCEVNYSCNSSSVYFSKVVDFLKKYDINMSDKQDLNVTTLKSSIDEFEPVFMYGKTSSGGGHWWVVDGYRTQVTTRGTFFPGYNVYMHANMGMGKSYTGYYLVGSDGSLTFDASFAHFNSELSMYANIRN